MNITPLADVTDGLIDCCWVGKVGLIRECICLVKIFSGSHLLEKKIEYTKGKQFYIMTDNHPVKADDEFIGYIRAIIGIQKKFYY